MRHNHTDAYLEEAMEEMDEMQARESLEQRREQEQRPLREAGQGEAEGFEEAEAALIEHASHGDSGPDPSDLAGKPEERVDVEYGEADHERSSEDQAD